MSKGASPLFTSVARRAIAEQNQPELSCERFFKINKVHRGIDEQPTLKAKKRFALSNSAFRSDPRDPWSVSYVGKVDWGGMEQHIKDVYTVSERLTRYLPKIRLP